MKKIDGYEFEQLVGRIMTSKGHQAIVTKKTGDSGTDIYAIMDGKQTVVQCKHHQDKVIGTPEIDKLLGVMAKNKIENGLFVCTGKFSQPAIDLAVSNNILLWDKEQIIKELGAGLVEVTPEVNFSSLSKDELKSKMSELCARFSKRFEEVSEATESKVVSLEIIKPLFSSADWSFIMPVLGTRGYNISNSSNIVEKDLFYERMNSFIDSEVRINKLARLKEILTELSNEYRTIPVEAIVKRASPDISDVEVQELLRKLHMSGDIFTPRTGFVTRIMLN